MPLIKTKISSKIYIWTAVALVIGFAAMVRIYRADWGLPYLYYWDEPQTASTALRMLKTGNFNPYFFNYGTLPIYINYAVDILHYLYLMGQPESGVSFLNSLQEIKTFADTKWPWTISHPSFYYWNRLTNIAFGVASVGLTFLIAQNVIGNKWVALVAALFFASINPHIEFSALVTPDVPVGFFVLAATFLSLRFLDKRDTKFLVYSLVCVGCAIATKYNSGLSILMPTLSVLIAYFKDRQSFNPRWWIYLLLVPIGTFFVCMPFAFLDSASFLAGLGFELRHYKIHGHGPFSSIPGIRHIKFQAHQIYSQIGFIGVLGAMLGLLACVKRPKLLFILVLPSAHFFYMTTMKVNFHRNFLVIYPFIAVSFAAAVWMLWKGFQHLKFKVGSASIWSNWIIRSLPILLVIAMLVHVGLMAQFAMRESKKIRQVVDSRTELINQLNSLTPKVTIKIPKELRIHDQDLRKLKYPYQLLPLNEILSGCVAAGTNYLVILPDRIEAGYEANDDEKQLGERYPGQIKEVNLGKAKLSLGQGHLSLEKFSVDPKLYVLDSQFIPRVASMCDN